MEGRVYKVMFGVAQKDMEKFFPSKLYPQSKKEILFNDSKSQAIVKFGERHNCDRIVIGSKGRTAVGDLLMGSVTQQVIRIATTPVVVVPNTRSRTLKVAKILVPTDFSDVSRKALDFAIHLAKFWGASIHILHVLDSRVLLYSLEKDSLSESVDTKAIDAAHKILLRIGGTSNVEKITTRTLVGDPPNEIVKYAHAKGMDLIVMGAHGMKGLKRVLIGSVTATVISKSKVPVITISSRYRDA
jgi:nucleotide-binding universal stress UspA family protein